MLAIVPTLAVLMVSKIRYRSFKEYDMKKENAFYVLLGAAAFIGIVDLYAFCRRRRIPIAPALRSYRSRAGFWLWALLVFEFLALVGAWPEGAAAPVNPETGAAGDWPVLGLALLGALCLPGWIVSRSRQTPGIINGISIEAHGSACFETPDLNPQGS